MRNVVDLFQERAFLFDDIDRAYFYDRLIDSSILIDELITLLDGSSMFKADQRFQIKKNINNKAYNTIFMASASFMTINLHFSQIKSTDLFNSNFSKRLLKFIDKANLKEIMDKSSEKEAFINSNKAAIFERSLSGNFKKIYPQKREFI